MKKLIFFTLSVIKLVLQYKNKISNDKVIKLIFNLIRRGAIKIGF